MWPIKFAKLVIYRLVYAEKGFHLKNDLGFERRRLKENTLILK